MHWLHNALVDCCVPNPRAVVFSLTGDAFEGALSGAGEFLKKEMAGKVADILKGQLGKIDGLDDNQAVKDAIEYAIEQATDAVTEGKKCRNKGSCNN